MPHIGAYVHCCKHVPGFNRIPVYATEPVITLGRVLILDLYASNPVASSTLPLSTLGELDPEVSKVRDDEGTQILFPRPSSNEIAECFSRVQSVKYSQPLQPQSTSASPLPEGLTVTAFPAGYTLGGSIWQIQYGREAVVYAVDWSLAKEHLIPGAEWLKHDVEAGIEVVDPLYQPTSLICSSKNTVSAAGGTEDINTNRDEVIIAHLRASLSQSGTVLIPCDADARMLEIAFALDKVWGDLQHEVTFGSSQVFLASAGAEGLLKQVQTLLEWMNPSLLKELERRRNQKQTYGNRSNDTSRADPKLFNFIKPLGRSEHVQSALASHGPKVFIASDSSLNAGFAKDILLNICSDARSTLLLTQRPTFLFQASQPLSKQACSLHSALWPRLTQDRTSDGAEILVEMSSARLSSLSEAQVTIYQKYLEKLREAELSVNEGPSEAIVENEAGTLEEEASESSESEDSDSEYQGRLLSSLAHPRHRGRRVSADEELSIKVLLGGHVHDYYMADKKKRKNKLFPYVPPKPFRFDDFGEYIDPKEFLQPHEREDIRQRKLQKRSKKQETASDRLANPRLQDRASSEARLEDGDNSDESEAEIQEEVEKDEDFGSTEPQSVTFETEPLDLSLQTAYVDFSALHDMRTMQMLLPHVKPRNLIITGGDDFETSALAIECGNLFPPVGDDGRMSISVNVHAPIDGVAVDATADTDAWVTKQDPRLSNAQQWRRFSRFQISFSNGKMKPDLAASRFADRSNKRQKLQQSNATGEEPDKTNANGRVSTMFSVSARQKPIAGKSVQEIHFGDINLRQLQQILQMDGCVADLQGSGTLIVNGSVIVRKHAKGQVDLDGGDSTMPSPSGDDKSMDESQYLAKERVYQMLAVLTQSG